MKEAINNNLLNRYSALKGWLYQNDIVIIERVREQKDLYFFKNLTNNKVFKLLIGEKNLIIKQLSGHNKDKIRANIQKYNVFRDTITNIIMSDIQSEIEEKLSSSWIKEEKFEKNLENSLTILEKRYMKKGKEEEFLFLKNLKTELEDSYNKWTGSGFNYKLFIYKQI